MRELLGLLYGDQASGVMDRIDRLADRYGGLATIARGPLWDQRSVMLITYADQVCGQAQSALEAQRQFLLDYGLDQLISAVHLLPFFPYSSDDGFAVIDYRRVNPAVGDWSDVARLGQSFHLAFDFVVNHCSQQHEWFQRYLRGERPYGDYFLEVDPATDLSAVTRPRSTPLLTPYETNRGTRHVWTTFSADQVDLNFACPELLLDALEILLFYIQHGARIIRLDAIGFLWKQPGTTCMHLPQTHAVVKLIRALVDAVAPGTILLTETNVPHEENVSYFGAGDEAHVVYQFSLAPLLLDAFLTGQADALQAWLAALEFPPAGRTYLNFAASHDGIGVRPLEGIVSPQRRDALVEGVRQRGGLVSLRTRPDGSSSPYELNIAYVSALNGLGKLSPAAHARKFLASQGLLLALRGVPGIYFHSLVGTENDTEGVRQTGHKRTINRRKFQSDELRQILADKNSLQGRIFDGYRHLLSVRRDQPAFHPDAAQTVLETGHPSLIGLTRSSADGEQRILVLANVGPQPVQVDLPRLAGGEVGRELLSGQGVSGGAYELDAHDIAWLV